MRHAAHPGPPAPERAMAVPAGAVPIEGTVRAGVRLLDGLADLLAGFHGGALTLSGGALGPFAYVIPGLSPDGSQVAFYSRTFRPAGLTNLEAAAVTVGTRAGAPFFHCHALWTEADGRRGCGHVLPDETVVAQDVAVRGAGIVGARFEVTPDPETGFSLFMPRPTAAAWPDNARPAIALRLAPNQDLIHTLEAVTRAAGFDRAILRGGVASINEARFEDAPDITGFATELLVRHGEVRGRAGGPSTLEITIVDHTNDIRTGRLRPGENPVLMTFEGLLVSAASDLRPER